MVEVEEAVGFAEAVGVLVGRNFPTLDRCSEKALWQLPQLPPAGCAVNLSGSICLSCKPVYLYIGN